LADIRSVLHRDQPDGKPGHESAPNAAHYGRNSIRKFGIGGYAGKRAVRAQGGRSTGENGRVRVWERGQPNDTRLKRKRNGAPRHAPAQGSEPGGGKAQGSPQYRSDRVGEHRQGICCPTRVVWFSPPRRQHNAPMKTKSFPLVLSLLALGFPLTGKAAPTCSVKDKVPSTARIFAKAGNDSAWREYASAEQVQDVGLDSGAIAQFVQHKRESPSVTVVKPGEDYWTYTKYCYGDDGELAGVSYEIRTQLGWGYRVDGLPYMGRFSANVHEFFSTKDGKTIAKPDGVTEAPAGLEPALYIKVSDLPFASLLKTTTAAKTHAGRHAGMALLSTGN
jgi:hypothetical protein